MTENFDDNIILDDDFDMDLAEADNQLNFNSQPSHLVEQSSDDALILTKNITFLFVKFLIYTSILVIICVIVAFKVLEYKGYENLLYIPIIPLIAYQFYIIINTVQQNSVNKIKLLSNGIEITDGKTISFYKYEHISKVELSTHRYTRIGMYKMMKLISQNQTQQNIIFKISYEDNIFDRIKYRLKQNNVEIE